MSLILIINELLKTQIIRTLLKILLKFYEIKQQYYFFTLSGNSVRNKKKMESYKKACREREKQPITETTELVWHTWTTAAVTKVGKSDRK